MGRVLSGTESLFEFIDITKDSHLSVVGQIQDDFFKDDGTSTFTVNFRSALTKNNAFSLIQKWANNSPSQDGHITSAKITTHDNLVSKRYLVSSLFPISVLKKPADIALTYFEFTAKFAYSLITEAR